MKRCRGSLTRAQHTEIVSGIGKPKTPAEGLFNSCDCLDCVVGYDLVACGAVVSIFLRDPSHIGSVIPAIAGLPCSDVLVGAMLAGVVGDLDGARTLSPICCA
jgi:hypothetical protein